MNVAGFQLRLVALIGMAVLVASIPQAMPGQGAQDTSGRCCAVLERCLFDWEVQGLKPPPPIFHCLSELDGDRFRDEDVATVGLHSPCRFVSRDPR